MEREDGVARNERLTGTTALLLILLLAVEGVTILFIRPLLSWHVFVGMLLIPPVALKLGTTGYRMVRYYGRSPAYMRRGPPPLFLRALAPIVVAATVSVFASGVALLVAGPLGTGCYSGRTRLASSSGSARLRSMSWRICAGCHASCSARAYAPGSRSSGAPS